MASLEAVVLPQDYRWLPCDKACVLCGYGVGVVAGELEGVKRSVITVMAQDGEDPVAKTRSACCAWPVDVVGVVSSCWAAGPVQTTTKPLPSTPARLRPVQHAAVGMHRRRRRTVSKDARLVEHAETQRLSHIAAERNRRRQMNQRFATLRGLMPRSYARRGDQASIVGGAIDFVKELEQRLKSLHAEKKRRYAATATGHGNQPFTGFFTSPQYSVSVASGVVVGDAGSARPGVATVEAAVSDGHATVKVLAPWRPGQKLLLRLLLGMQQHGLAALHLNVTTIPSKMVFYTITLRMGDECPLLSAGDVAAAVHDIVAEANTAEGLHGLPNWTRLQFKCFD